MSVFDNDNSEIKALFDFARAQRNASPLTKTPQMKFDEMLSDARVRRLGGAVESAKEILWKARVVVLQNWGGGSYDFNANMLRLNYEVERTRRYGLKLSEMAGEQEQPATLTSDLA